MVFLICEEIFNEIPIAISRRQWLVLGILILYLLYRPMLSALWSQFHPSTLGMPLVAGVILCLHRRKDGVLAILIFFLLMTKEMGALSVLGLSIYAWMVLGRKRVSLVLAVVSAIYAAVVLGVVMPHFRDNSWGHLGRVDPVGHLSQKVHYFWRLVVPLGFLPFFGWRALLAAAPLICLNLATGFEPQFSLKFHYDDQSSVFWIVAAAHGARRVASLFSGGSAGWTLSQRSMLQRSIPFLSKTSKWILPALIILIIACLGITYRGRSPIEEARRVWPTPAVREIHRQLTKYQNLAAEIPIVAQSSLGPHLCNRFAYRSLGSDISKIKFETGTVVFISRDVGNFAPDPVPRNNHSSEKSLNFSNSSRGLSERRYDAWHKFFSGNPRVIEVERTPCLEVYVWK